MQVVYGNMASKLCVDVPLRILTLPTLLLACRRKKRTPSARRSGSHPFLSPACRLKMKPTLSSISVAGMPAQDEAHSFNKALRLSSVSVAGFAVSDTGM